MKKKQQQNSPGKDVNQYRQLVELSPEPTAIHADGRILFVNRAGLDLIGAKNTDEVTGKPVLDFVHPKYHDAIKERVRRITEGGDIVPLIEEKFVRLDGTTIDVEVVAMPVTWEGKQAIQVVFRDLTERKRAEEGLKRSLSLLQATLDSTADGILVVNNEGKIESYNQKFVEMWKIPSSIIASRDDQKALEFVLDQLKEPDAFLRKVQELYANPEATSFDILEFKDGRVFERYSRPQRIDGKSVGRVWSFLDVTESKKSERELRASEVKFRSLFENVLDGVYQSTEDGKLLTGNPALVRMLGYNSLVELLKADIATELYVDPTQRRDLLEKLNKQGQVRNAELTLRGKDGRVITVLENSRVVRDEQGTVLYYEGTLTDISERKNSERALRESEERYHQFFDQGLAGHFISTVDGNILACNPAFARIFGFTSVEEVLKTPAEEFYSDPAVRKSFLKLLKEKKKLESYQIEMRHRDGSMIYVMEDVAATFNENGGIVQMTGYVLDLTEQKRLEEQLRQAQRMESVGTLAGGIAHDFNNILAIINGYSALLKKGDGDPVKRAQWFEAIATAVDRGAGVVRQLLTFAHKQAVEFKPLDINHVIREFVNFVRETFPESVEFQLDLENDIPAVVGDSGQLQQALLNLCVNARDSMPGGGTISILSRQSEGYLVKKRYAEADAKSYVLVEVRDSGAGMSKETQTRIFEPFFTTKEFGEGSGLGLAVVYGVVKSHQAFIDVDSQVGKGTSMRIYFPASFSAPAQVADRKEAYVSKSSGEETVLLVEDEPMILDLLKEVLEGGGYKVMVAQNGEEAVDVYSNAKDRIAVVLSDMGLPKLGGWEAFQQMKQLNPRVKAILASGYLDPRLKSEMIKAGARDFIQKPYVPEQILQRIREVIDSTS